MIKKFIFALFIFAISLSYAQSQSIIDTVKYFEKNDKLKYNIDIAYPQVTDKKNESRKYFNSYIKKFIDREIKEFKNDDNFKDRYSDLDYELMITYDVNYNNEKLISLVMYVYRFMGGAHGSTVMHSVNFDVNNNKLLKLSDLFKGKYIKFISDYCIKEILKEEFSDENWVKEGAGPSAENFDTFVLDTDGIKFLFQQYQVVPYATGMPEVFISSELMKKYIKEGSILSTVK